MSLSATVASTIPGGSATTGTVQFFNGADPLGMGTLTNGIASISTTVLPLGASSITAQYSGDGNYTTSTSQAVTATVKQAATTTLTPSSTSIVFGQALTLSAQVVASDSSSTDVPTGTVQFFNGTTLLGTGTLNGNTATLSNVILPAGSDSLTARYQGDTNFGINTSPAVTVAVAHAATTTNLNTSPNPSVVGNSVTLAATVTANSPGAGTPTGTVQFFNGTTPLGTGTLSNGTATITSTTLPQGTNSITAQYLGDSNFNGSTSTAVTQTVNPAPLSTITTVAVSPSPSVFGQSVMLTAGVSSSGAGVGVPTGTVEFFTGSTSLGTATLNNGVAMLTTTALTAGANSLKAKYQGDTTFATSTSQVVTATVNQASTTTTLAAATPNPSQSGQVVTLTANVAVNSPGAGTPTGSVQFFNGTTSLGTATLSNGVATLSTTALTAGTLSLTAQYQGDTHFASSTSAAVAQTVTVGNSMVTVFVSKANPVTTESVVISATVAASGTATGSPSGTVVFFANGVNLGSGTISNGVASLTTSDLAVGSQQITAVYQGDANFDSSTSSPLAIVVGDSNELFLNQAYLQLLRRPIDQPGLDQWYTLLVTGTPRKEVVRAIATSPEAQAVVQQTGTIVPGVSARVPHGRRARVHRLNQIYQQVLNRAPTRHEVRAQIHALNTPHSEKALIIDLIASDEFSRNATLNA